MAGTGFDITTPATKKIVADAKIALGSVPQFVGRYFKGPGNTDPIQYQPASENAILHQVGLRVLCVARQTNKVGGSQASGATYGNQHASAVVAAFGHAYLAGLGYDPIIFLDVEPAPPLSVEYWTGWSSACRAGITVGGKTVRFTPAIYINRFDDTSWNNLASAMAGGAGCACAWVARYISWKAGDPPPVWDEEFVSPEPPAQAPCPILLWQFIGDYKDIYDFSVISTAIGADAVVGLMPVAPASAA